MNSGCPSAFASMRRRQTLRKIGHPEPVACQPTGRVSRDPLQPEQIDIRGGDQGLEDLMPLPDGWAGG